MNLHELPHTVLRRAQAFLGLPYRFLRDVRGVIHVGASTGQERRLYARHRLRVVWVEPIPEVFATLEKNIAEFPSQRAIRALISDVDGAELTLHVSSNNGESSSILQLKEHRDIWPQVTYTHSISVVSTTLDALVAREAINLDDYGALVLDTQGTELLVLKGARAALEQLRYVKAEAPDFESYEGCCQVQDIESFLVPLGFREKSRYRFAVRKAGGAYYDIVYRRS